MYVILGLVLLIIITAILLFKAAARTILRGLLTGIDALYPGAAYRIVRFAGVAWGIAKFLLALGFLALLAAIVCGK